MKKIIILILFITGIANSLWAQKLTAEANKTSVAVGEPIQVTFSLNGNGTDLKIAHLNEFDLYQNPYSSSSTMVINGVVSQTYSLTYVIGAKKEGKVTLGPATITVNGTTIQSNTITFDVGKASSPQQNNSQNSNGAKSSNDNLILVAQPNKTKVYVGEDLTLDYKILFRVDILNYSVPKLPSMDGCFVQDGKNSPQTTEIVDGKKYMSAGIKKLYVIPQRTGKITIDPLEAEFVVRQQSGRRSNDIFDQIFGGGYEEVKYKLRSKPVVIEVLPLPEDHKPAGFSGAVGNYTFKATISKDKVKANEAINITVTVTGKGNVKLIDPLKINFPEDFETYDPKVTQSMNASDVLSGSKTFDYTIIPRHEGDYKIDHLDFSYFDPEKKAYVVLPSPEFNIHVDKGDPNDINASAYTPQNNKEEVKVLGDDIRYIKTGAPDLKSSEDHFFGSPVFYMGFILPLLAFISFIIIRKKNIEKNKDAIAVKGRKATKMARKRLVVAEQNLKAANKEKFYVEISQALYGYVSDKLNISVAHLTKENITNTLQSKGVTDVLIENLITTIDTCEYARYAPNAVSGDLQTIYNNTVELITKLENEIR
jgi:hypothetical protein